MKVGVLARIGAPLALIALCALVKPASANVLVDLAVGTSQAGPFHKQLVVVPDTQVYFRVATLNRFAAPALAVTEIPLIRFSQREVLLPGRVNNRLVTAVGRNPGTYRITAHVRFLNPFTGRVHEVTDSVVVIVGTLGPIDPGKKGGQQQGGQQQGGVGDKKDDLDDIFGKKDDTGGAGQQQGGQQQTGGAGQQGGTGSQGGQQQQAGKKDDTAGKKDDTKGAGQQQGGQQQQAGDKKDGTGGFGKDGANFVF